MKSTHNQRKHLSLGASALACAVALSYATPTLAQDASSDTLEEVQITGTRIKRSGLYTPTPTTVLDRDTLEFSGASNMQDMLMELPAISNSYSPTTSQSGTHTSGLSVVNLRNLGSERTLVLVDGKRVVGASQGSTRVDQNMIAADFVERTEVITGGASAIYGSDAIAGVVNIITRRDFEGLKLRGEYGGSEHGGRAKTRLSAMIGSNLSDDRGNVMFAVEYEDRNGLKSGQRDFASENYDYDLGDNILESGGKSSYLPGGRFWSSRRSSSRDRDVDYLWFKDGQMNIGAFDSDTDGYNYQPLYQLYIPTERYTINGKGFYKLTDDVEFYFSGMFASYNTLRERAPDAVSYSKLWPVSSYTYYDGDAENPPERVRGISLDNPFVPDAYRDYLINGYKGDDKYIRFYRRMVELGPRSKENDRDALRIVGGLRGDLGSNFSWDVSYVYGRMMQSQVQTGDVILDNFRDALDVESDGKGGYQCKDPLARRAGCVPINIFGEGSISPEAANYVTSSNHFKNINTQKVISGHISGDLFELPAGAVGVAVGFEHRTEEYQTRTDSLLNLGQTSYNLIPHNGGDYSVKEGFGEIFVPLLSNESFAKELSFEAALRIADYSVDTVGTVYSYKTGLSWAPNDNVRFRANYSRASRTPYLRDLYSVNRETYASLSDPCDGVTADSTGAYDAICRQDAGIAAKIAADGVYEDTDSRSKRGYNKGNPGLHEEVSDSYTFGVVITPTAIPDLSLTVDYYDIKVKDAIAQPGRQYLLNSCYNGSAPSSCVLIERDSDGLIDLVNNYSINNDRLQVRGLDFNARYRFDLDKTIGLPGTVSTNLIWEHRLKAEKVSQDDEGNPVVRNYLGEVGDYKNRARFTLRYINGPLAVSWTTKYLGSARIDEPDQQTIAEGIAERGDASEQALFDKIEAKFYHNIYARYYLDDDRKFQLYGGIRNVFDNEPPFLPSPLGSSRCNSSCGYYDVIGRYFYAGFKISM